MPDNPTHNNKLLTDILMLEIINDLLDELEAKNVDVKNFLNVVAEGNQGKTTKFLETYFSKEDISRLFFKVKMTISE